MLRNYLITAWRNLLRNRVNSTINIIGLALALGCGLLVLQFVRHELGFDGFHEKAGRVFLVYAQVRQPTGTRCHTQLSAAKQEALAESFPGIARAARVAWFSPQIGQGEGAVEQKGAAVDPAFLEMFSFPLFRGNPATALASPEGVVLSETACRQLWATEDPMGQVVTVQAGGGARDFTVTGVLQDIPENSSLRFDVLLSQEGLAIISGWGVTQGASGSIISVGGPSCIFVELAEKTSAAKVEPLLTSLLRRDQRSRESLHLLGLDQLHSAPPFLLAGAQLQNRGKPAHVYTLSGIGVLVLAMACITFANLALGRASLRAGEIGVRKVVGAERRDLLWQFWGEAVLLSLLALVLGLVLAQLLLPFFNNMVERSLELDLTRPGTLLTCLGLAVLVGTVAGAYPAAVLSGLRPVSVFGRALEIGGRTTFSRGLIVLQFALSTILVVCTLGMERQIDYLQVKGLGFDGDQVIRASLPRPTFSQALEAFKHELAAHPQLVHGCVGATPTLGFGEVRTRWKSGELTGLCRPYYVEHGFVETLGLDVLAGRDFSPEFATDTGGAVIVNQTLARALGVDDPVGQELVEVSIVGQETRLRIIGVVNDFHYSSLHQKIEPVIVRIADRMFLQSLVRLDAANIPAALETARSAWERAVPDREFRYEFLDDRFAGMYRQEERWGWIMRAATGFALLIACLGLFGLMALVSGRRTKEISIRRILGASARQIVGLLTWEFSALVVSANLVAWPVAYFAMGRWLEGFAYRIELGPGLYLLGGSLALGIAWLTVSWQAIHVSLANPVSQLRYE